MSCSPGKNTGVGCHILFQGIFLTQGSNPSHLLGRWTLPLNHLSDFYQDIIIILHQMAQWYRICLPSRKHGMILGLGRSPGEGNSSTLQYFCLGNPMDKGAWRGEIPSAAGKKKNNSSIYLCYS